MKKSRIGEQARSTNGQLMTLIEYNNCKDITVQFEDGTIVKNRSINNFRKGLIRNPYTAIRKKYNIKSRVGETSIASNGMKITIVEYNKADDLTVQFEDGTIAEHKTYRRFKDGRIKHPDRDKRAVHVRHIGEKYLSYENEIIEIIEYKDLHNIKVKYEDGTIINNVTLYLLKNGLVHKDGKHGNCKNKLNIRYDRIGKQTDTASGLKATIIEYNNNADMTVQFEDGEIVKNIRYKNFKNGIVKHPYLKSRKSCNSKLDNARKRNIGLKVVNKQGDLATVIDYIECNNVTVQFKDGTIVKGVRIYDFRNGNVFKNTKAYRLKTNRVGEKTLSHSGQQMEIVEYRSYKDIDVKFEDGNIVKHRDYYAFKSGHIANIHKDNKDK